MSDPWPIEMARHSFCVLPHQEKALECLTRDVLANCFSKTLEEKHLEIQYISPAANCKPLLLHSSEDLSRAPWKCNISLGSNEEPFLFDMSPCQKKPCPRGFRLRCGSKHSKMPLDVDFAEELSVRVSVGSREFAHFSFEWLLEELVALPVEQERVVLKMRRDVVPLNACVVDRLEFRCHEGAWSLTDLSLFVARLEAVITSDIYPHGEDRTLLDANCPSTRCVQITESPLLDYTVYFNATNKREQVVLYLLNALVSSCYHYMPPIACTSRLHHMQMLLPFFETLYNDIVPTEAAKKGRTLSSEEIDDLWRDVMVPTIVQKMDAHQGSVESFLHIDDTPSITVENLATPLWDMERDQKLWKGIRKHWRTMAKDLAKKCALGKEDPLYKKLMYEIRREKAWAHAALSAMDFHDLHQYEKWSVPLDSCGKPRTTSGGSARVYSTFSGVVHRELFRIDPSFLCVGASAPYEWIKSQCDESRSLYLRMFCCDSYEILSGPCGTLLFIDLNKPLEIHRTVIAAEHCHGDEPVPPFFAHQEVAFVPDERCRLRRIFDAIFHRPACAEVLLQANAEAHFSEFVSYSLDMSVGNDAAKKKRLLPSHAITITQTWKDFRDATKYKNPHKLVQVNADIHKKVYEFMAWLVEGDNVRGADDPLPEDKQFDRLAIQMNAPDLKNKGAFAANVPVVFAAHKFERKPEKSELRVHAFSKAEAITESEYEAYVPSGSVIFSPSTRIVEKLFRTFIGTQIWDTEGFSKSKHTMVKRDGSPMSLIDVHFGVDGAPIALYEDSDYIPLLTSFPRVVRQTVAYPSPSTTDYATDAPHVMHYFANEGGYRFSGLFYMYWNTTKAWYVKFLTCNGNPWLTDSVEWTTINWNGFAYYELKSKGAALKAALSSVLENALVLVANAESFTTGRVVESFITGVTVPKGSSTIILEIDGKRRDHSHIEFTSAASPAVSQYKNTTKAPVESQFVFCERPLTEDLMVDVIRLFSEEKVTTGQHQYAREIIVGQFFAINGARTTRIVDLGYNGEKLTTVDTVDGTYDTRAVRDLKWGPIPFVASEDTFRGIAAAFVARYPVGTAMSVFGWPKNITVQLIEMIHAGSHCPLARVRLLDPEIELTMSVLELYAINPKIIDVTTVVPVSTVFTPSLDATKIEDPTKIFIVRSTEENGPLIVCNEKYDRTYALSFDMGATFLPVAGIGNFSPGSDPENDEYVLYPEADIAYALLCAHTAVVDYTTLIPGSPYSMSIWAPYMSSELYSGSESAKKAVARAKPVKGARKTIPASPKPTTVHPTPLITDELKNARSDVSAALADLVSMRSGLGEYFADITERVAFHDSFNSTIGELEQLRESTDVAKITSRVAKIREEVEALYVPGRAKETESFDSALALVNEITAASALANDAIEKLPYLMKNEFANSLADIVAESERILKSEAINGVKKSEEFRRILSVVAALKTHIESKVEIIDSSQLAPAATTPAPPSPAPPAPSPLPAPPATPVDTAEQTLTRAHDLELESAAKIVASARAILTDIDKEAALFPSFATDYPDAALVKRYDDIKLQETTVDDALQADPVDFAARLAAVQQKTTIDPADLEWNLRNLATNLEMEAIDLYTSLTNTVRISNYFVQLETPAGIRALQFYSLLVYTNVPGADIENEIAEINKILADGEHTNTMLSQLITRINRLNNDLYPAYLKDPAFQAAFKKHYRKTERRAEALKVFLLKEYYATCDDAEITYDDDVVDLLEGTWTEDDEFEDDYTEFDWLSGFAQRFDDSAYASSKEYFADKRKHLEHIIAMDIRKRAVKGGKIPSLAPSDDVTRQIVVDDGLSALGISRLVRVRDVRANKLKFGVRTSTGETIVTETPLGSKFSADKQAISVFHSLCASTYNLSHSEGGIDWTRTKPVYLEGNILDVLLGDDEISTTLPPIAQLKGLLARRGAVVFKVSQPSMTFMFFIKKDPATAKIALEGLSLIVTKSAL
jgi:hypothetical protein